MTRVTTDAQLRVVTDASQRNATQRNAQVEWQDLVEPSVELALNFTVGDLLAKRIAVRLV
jgi:hypothetical protein